MIVNKAKHGGMLFISRFRTLCAQGRLHLPAPHFQSYHGRFGLITSILLITQALLGILIAYDPGFKLLGGEARAKSLWKYHRKLV